MMQHSPHAEDCSLAAPAVCAKVSNEHHTQTEDACASTGQYMQTTHMTPEP